MARTAKPWYRAAEDGWYIYQNGKQVLLAKGKENKAEAVKAFHELMAGHTLEKLILVKVAKIFDLFLDRCQTETESYEHYKMFLQDAANHFGGVLYHRFRVHHVTEWLRTKGDSWSDTTRNKAIGAVKAAVNYCITQGYIPAPSPIAHLKKPPCGVRDRILTPEERKILVDGITDQPFAELVFAMLESGCRPSDVRRLEAEHVSLDKGLWIFKKHKTVKKTKRPRIIYLSPALLALTKRLVEEHPTGKLFLNSRVKPWTQNAIRCRFQALRAKHPELKGVISYTLRTTFTTDALEKGIPDAVVAELLGHSGTATLHHNYAKLEQKIDLLKKAAGQAGQVTEP